MADPVSLTQGSHTVDMGGIHTSDEAELARMGYKQELKCVYSNFFWLLRFMAFTDYQA